MVRGATVSQEVRLLPFEDLESGTYTYVYHGSKTQFKDIDALKAEVKERWEQEEGLTVLSIEFRDVLAGKIPTENLIWQDGDTARVQAEDHTTLTIKFKIDSPFPWVLLLILIIVVVAVIGLYIVAGIFEKFVELVYKEPIIALGIIAVLFVFGLALAGVKIPKRKREE